MRRRRRSQARARRASASGRYSLLGLASSANREGDSMKRFAIAALLGLALIGTAARQQAQAQQAQAQAQQGRESGAPTDYSRWSPQALQNELERRGVTERKVLVRMRDGIGLSTDIYRPRITSGPVPTIFIRTPYNMNTLE